jgi:hypothetical protein
MSEKMLMVVVSAAALLTGLGVTDVFARGGGRGGAPSGLGVGAASQGAALATQQRVITQSTPRSGQMSIPRLSNPLSQSTLSSPPVTGPRFEAADGGHWQPTPSQLPQNVRNTEGSISTSDKALDKALTICRGC